MEGGGIILVVLLILGAPLALAVWLIVRAVEARSRVEEISQRLRRLEMELLHLKKGEPAPEYRPIKSAAESVAAAIAKEPEAPPIKPAEPPVAPQPVAPPVFTTPPTPP